MTVNAHFEELLTARYWRYATELRNLVDGENAMERLDDILDCREELAIIERRTSIPSLRSNCIRTLGQCLAPKASDSSTDATQGLHAR